MNNNCNQNLEHQQQQQRQSSNDGFKAPEERPYRRIKPPPDKVHHVQPARFRRFVQRHTCCLQLPEPQQPNVPPPGRSNSDDAAAAPSAATEQVLQPPPDAKAAVGGSSDDPGIRGERLNATRKSMQDAYMAWCSSNDIPLSPGTMAELLPPS